MKSIGYQELIAMLQRFQNPKEYAALKKSCAKAVTEWRWATSLMLPEMPHDDIVRGFKPPKWVKKQPRYGSLHGLDSGGRIQCIRDDDVTKPDKEVHEQFLIRESNGFWCIYFDTDPKKVLMVKWFEMEVERWLRSLQVGHYGVREYVLHWEGSQLARYIDRSWSGESSRDPKAAAGAQLKEKDAQETIYLYSYAGDGELDRVTQKTDAIESEQVEVKYQRIPKEVSLDLLLRQAEDLLVTEIPKAIKKAKVRDIIYGLFLQFTGVDTDPNGFAPPMLLATESLRRRLLSERQKEAAWYLWAVPEWEGDPAVVRVACKNAALDEKLHLIFQLTVVQASPPKYGPVRKMFQRVCARLNAFNWKGILKTTDAFVVMPFDPHGELDQKVDLKASIPMEKLRLLMDRGYIARMKLK